MNVTVKLVTGQTHTVGNLLSAKYLKERGMLEIKRAPIFGEDDLPREWKPFETDYYRRFEDGVEVEGFTFVFPEGTEVTVA